MLNFEWLLTRVKEQYLENHLRHEELALIVRDLLDLVHNVILMSVYLDLETPGGQDFG
jgi:hypothetical protein